jgi:hypothetical protein
MTFTFSNVQIAKDWIRRLADERSDLPEWWFAGKVQEEAGESWRAYIRLVGFHRHVGTTAQYAEELADTVISAYAAAIKRGIDLDGAIQRKHTILMSREMREEFEEPDLLDERPEDHWRGARQPDDPIRYSLDEAAMHDLADDIIEPGPDMFEDPAFADDSPLKAAADYIRAVGLRPNQDAIEQLALAFTPCLKIMCERGYAQDGSTWKAGGWRGLIFEMLKKMERVRWLDWAHSMDAMHEMPDILNFGGMYMRGRYTIDRFGPTFGEPSNFQGEAPEIITLCGSTRFAKLFHEVNLRETILGRIVLSIGCDTHSDDDLVLASDLGISLDGEDKANLDRLHKRKIDMSSRIVVISDKTGYIGDSTRSEIGYALANGKVVDFMSPAAEENYNGNMPDKALD